MENRIPGLKDRAKNHEFKADFGLRRKLSVFSG
jgi:hypothetical protein